MNLWNEATFFPLGGAYELGMKMAAEINEKINGRMTESAVDLGVLAQMIHNGGHGDHLELGIDFGGTAILAGKIKEHYGLRGKVVCVGALNGEFRRPDPGCGIVANEEVFFRNVERFGMENRVELIVGEFRDVVPQKQCGYSSGSTHAWQDFERTLGEWNLVKGQASRLVRISGYGGTAKSAEKLLRIANTETDWRCVAIFGISAVFERVGGRKMPQTPFK